MSKQAWPSSLSKTSSNFLDLAPYKGAVREENGKMYQLVKASAATIAATDVCVYSAADIDAINGDGIVVVKSTAASPFVTRVHGVAPVAVGASEYFWLQIAGIASVTADTAGITAGTYVCGGNATNGRAENCAAAADLPFALALETKAAAAAAKVLLLSLVPSSAPLA